MHPSCPDHGLASCRALQAPAPVVAVLILLAGTTQRVDAGVSDRVDPAQAVVVDRGALIAFGSEHRPPFTLAIEHDSLCIYEPDGSRYVGLFNAPAGDGPEAPAGLDLVLVRAQLAHLLSRGGLILLGTTYAVALPPARAAAVLPKLRWVIHNRPESRLSLPQDDPLIRDLVHPAEAPPRPPRAPMSSE